MAYALDGFSHAVEALGGSAYGAQQKARFQRAVTITLIWIGVAALITSVVYFFSGELMLSFFTNSKDVLNSAKEYLPWVIIFPLVSCWSYHLDGLFIGTGYAREMRNAMLLSTTGYLLMAYYLQDALANHGLYLALVGIW